LSSALGAPGIVFAPCRRTVINSVDNFSPAAKAARDAGSAGSAGIIMPILLKGVGRDRPQNPVRESSRPSIRRAVDRGHRPIPSLRLQVCIFVRFAFEPQ
jgi:hypothetical protein